MGFRREGAGCEVVIVPPHAHLDESGRHWRCDTGFRALSRVCIPSASGNHAPEIPVSSDERQP